MSSDLIMIHLERSNSKEGVEGSVRCSTAACTAVIKERFKAHGPLVSLQLILRHRFRLSFGRALRALIHFLDVTCSKVRKDLVES